MGRGILFSFLFFILVAWDADMMALVLAAMWDHEDEGHILDVK